MGKGRAHRAQCRIIIVLEDWCGASPEIPFHVTAYDHWGYPELRRFRQVAMWSEVEALMSKLQDYSAYCVHG